MYYSKNRLPVSVIRNSASLLAGETVLRLASFLTLAAVSRKFGPSGVGLVAFAQVISQYAWVVSDGGLRFIGTRLVARGGDPSDVLHQILNKRLLLLTVIAPIVFVAVSRLTESQFAAQFTLIFCCSALPVALTPDFVASGQQRFILLLHYRSIVSAVLLAFTAWFAFSQQGLLTIAIGTPVAYSAGTVVLWASLSRAGAYHQSPGISSVASRPIELRWANVVRTGLSLVLNQTLLSVSSIVLISRSSISELGIYSSAYRVVAIIASAFFVITQALFPMLAAMGADRSSRLLGRWWLWASLAGIAFAAVLAAGSGKLMPILFGNQFSDAAPILSKLVIVIPIEIGNALLGTYLLARGRTTALLTCVVLAVILSLILNFLLVPAHGASGAAVATISTAAGLLAAQTIAIFGARRFLI
jgi:O-antigen/teichoic acid export membrane protein